jgi:hypothetical protein
VKQLPILQATPGPTAHNLLSLNAEIGTACRFVGGFDVNKVSGNFHITPLGHTYGGVHTPHELMNFTHRIDAFTFGTVFPNSQLIFSNPLSKSYELLEDST